MDLTPELVARCHREVPVTPSRYTRAEEAELAALADRLLPGHDGPFWIFAYGSLIWKNCFDPAEIRKGTAHGWHRAFRVKLTGFRGTPDSPGLMMTLARGGRCSGLLMRLADGSERAVLGALVNRELPYREFFPMARWIRVDTEDGPLRALVFWAGRFPPGDATGLSQDEIARMIASACGYAGSCADYLYQTVAGLERHGIHDRNLWQLQKLVASEIMSRGEGPPNSSIPAATQTQEAAP